jgi:hypothetical protein
LTRGNFKPHLAERVKGSGEPLPLSLFFIGLLLVASRVYFHRKADRNGLVPEVFAGKRRIMPIDSE